MTTKSVDYIYLNGGEPIYLKFTDEYVFSHDWTDLGGGSGNLTNPLHTLYILEAEDPTTALSGSTNVTNAPVQVSKIITSKEGDTGKRYVNNLSVDIDGLKHTVVIIVIPHSHGQQRV